MEIPSQQSNMNLHVVQSIEKIGKMECFSIE